jgi:hypothetical protein
MRKLMAVAGALFLALLVPSLRAQDVSSITGIVTDSTGAVVPGVNVMLANPATGFTYNAVTNEVGSYTIVHVPPGPGYKVTFSRDGFKPTVVIDVYLNVNSTRTQNAQLAIGGTSATVEVSAADQGVTLDTTDSSIGNNYEVQMVNELPIQVRDSPFALFTIQPGVTNDGAVTGSRTDQNNVTLDGLDVNDMATGQFGAVVGNAPVDSVQELRAVTANPLASEGQGGGGQFTMVTKSGTNNWHGALFEYHRDTATEANNWFANNIGVPRAQLIRNQFGGNVGGPILKNKAFFFFEYNGRRDNQGVQVNTTVPMDSFRNGNISYINKNTDPATGAPCGGSSRKDTTPTCISTIDSAAVAQLDPQHVGFSQPLLAFITQRYPHANDVTGGDGINTAGFFFNAPVLRTQNDYVARVDYTLNNSMKLWARGSVLSSRAGDATNFDAPIQFPGDPETHLINDASYSYVIGHNWIIGANKSNAFYYGVTRSRLNFAVAYNPTGTVQWTAFGGNGSGGAILTDPYASAVNAQVRNYPIPVVRDDFSWVKGKHSFQFGGLFKFIKTYEDTYLNYDQPLLGLGGNMNALNASLRPSDIRTAGTISSRTYDSAFALALGRLGQVTSTYAYNSAEQPVPQGTGAVRQYRYYELEGYFGDSWKATPDLTLTYGVRYSWYSVPYEVNGKQSVQDLTFNDYFDQRLQQSAAGASGDSTLPFISYNLGGKANHGPGYYDSNLNNFAPRLAFAYNPGFARNTVISGGFGVVFDHTVTNAVQYQQDQYSYLFQSSANLPFGTPGDPVASLQNDPRFTAVNAIPAAPAAPVITHPFTPYVDSNGVPNGLAGGQAFNETIDRHLRTPYNLVMDFGVQHQFPRNYILKVDYAGRLGRRLLAQADANQLIDFPDKASGQMMSTAFGNITKEVRAGADTTNLPAEPWFENVVFPGLYQFFVDANGNPYPNNTSLLADSGALPFQPLVSNGDFGDFIQALSAFGVINSNVGMASQFSENTYYTNKGFSNYQGLLATLHKNLSNGLQFDLNYTYSHSIDNVSLIANVPAFAGYGFVCDVVRPTECVGNSDFDQKHIITGNVLYNLPFGRGRTYGANMPFWANEILGGWDISALPSWHSGIAFSTVSSAFVAGYANNAPAILTGSWSNVAPNAHKTTDGSVNLFKDQDKALASFEGPIGFQIGTRNNLRGPNYVNFDLGVAKAFPIHGDNMKLKFRCDAFNAFNHPNFDLPVTANTDITGGSNFGKLTKTVVSPSGASARVLQGALRFEF